MAKYVKHLKTGEIDRVSNTTAKELVESGSHVYVSKSDAARAELIASK